MIEEDTIKQLGEYEARVKVYKNVIATVKFVVVGE
jgi:ribosomal protein L9